MQKIIEKPDDIQADVTTDDTVQGSDIRDLQTAIREPNKGELPQELQFYSGGEKEAQKLKATVIRGFGGVMSKGTEEFLDYLTLSTLARRLLPRNKVKIQINNSKLLIANVLTDESLYTFSQNQEDKTKKYVKVNIQLHRDYEYYHREILSDITDDSQDLLTNPISKFLFYRYNMLRVGQNKKPLRVRHSQVSEDNYTLERL